MTLQNYKTMASAREKTPQLGLWDDEVPKLSHDVIVLWAYENAEQIVRSYLAAYPKKDYFDIINSKWTSIAITNNSGSSLGNLPPLPEKPPGFQITKTIEQVIEQHPEYVNGRSLPRILGYGDLLIRWFAPRVEWHEGQWHVSNRDAGCLLVEAKTAMPSLGELMRQLNLYRLVYRDVVVISPDSSYQNILHEQGILFVEYKADE
jgi:hypothetical protein